MKRKPLQVCVRVLRAFIPVLLLTLGGSVPCFGGVIASSNFNSATAQDSLPAVSWSPVLSLGSGVPAANSYAALVANSGAVDTTTNNGGAGPFASGARSTSLQLHVNFTNATGSTWTGSARTPILAVTNTESALNRLNVSFDMSPSLTLPVRFRIESFSSTSDTPTGALEGLVIPSSFYSFYRYSVDLNTLHVPSGSSRAFVPNGSSGKRIRFTFYLDGGTGSNARWPKGDNNTIAVDNLCYSSPSLWVSNTTTTNTGADSSHPTTVGDAFSRVQPGDVVCFLAGTYNNIPGFQARGTPSRWITLRAAPGATPVLMSTGWSILNVAGSSAYVDIRGFTVQGIYDETNATNAANLVRDALSDGALLTTYQGQEYNPAYMVYYDDPYGRASNVNYGSSYYNSNGIYINGNQKWGGSSVVNTADNEGVHHVRIADNTIKDTPAVGIGVAKADYVYIENNVVKETSHLTRYATSGISVISSLNFDGNGETKVFVIRNECARNRTDVPWTLFSGGGNNDHKVELFFSDGNGIIVDINRNVDVGDGTLPHYQGRTLVQNNVCYENGGSGIHTVGAAQVDIVNNTAFNNDQPNKATGTIKKVTYTQISATANSFPVANYSTLTDAQNSAGTRLGYGQLFAGYASQDVHLFNNIAWAPAGCDVNSAFPGGNSSLITYNNNVFGRYGADGGVYSTGFTYYYNNTVVSADPLKIFTSVTVGDSTFLRLQGGSPNYGSSPAIDVGVNDQGAPFLDFDRDFRPVGAAIDAGAFEVDY